MKFVSVSRKPRLDYEICAYESYAWFMKSVSVLRKPRLGYEICACVMKAALGL